MLLGSTKWSGALLALLLVAPVYAQTLTIEPAVAKPGQAIVGTLSAVPDLPDGAIDEKVTVTLEGGAAINCGLDHIHLWPSLPKSTATWKRTAHVPVLETYFAPGPQFNPARPRIEDLILKQRVVSDTPVEQVVTATVVLEGVAPPEPKPPGPVPIPGDGLRVVMIYESGDKLPEAKLQTLYSSALRELVVSQKGKLRFYDKDQKPTEAWVVDAMKRPRTSLPWWIYSNGTQGGEGPLPDEAAALETLKKLGGGQ